MYEMKCPLCDYVFDGDSVDEILAKGSKHARNYHDLTENELKDPQMVKYMKGRIKKLS